MTRRDKMINSILRLILKIRPLNRFLSKFNWYTNLMNRQARKIINNLGKEEEKKDTTTRDMIAIIVIFLVFTIYIYIYILSST